MNGVDFERGYFCAVATLIKMHGLNTPAEELFNAGGDYTKADKEDIKVFKENGLLLRWEMLI